MHQFEVTWVIDMFWLVRGERVLAFGISDLYIGGSVCAMSDKVAGAWTHRSPTCVVA